uniref:Uncharacterized protein n=1 Tax=Aureoumbra lagunensis TaxID=44058 RepID=A0A7S3K388_9STRA|mmetsp:Transcript_6458/g.9076  ORF Transcript_6458/g.9076 Transcript_6458/m.9076 type:complete len:137 (+) Transcript_6458:90-500(+)
MFAATRRLLGKAKRPLTKPRRGIPRFEGGSSLLPILFPLGRYGVGAKVNRVTWNSPNCYWLITKIKYNKRAIRDDGSIHRGKVWGSLYWRDKLVGTPDRKVPGHCKPRWQLLEEPTDPTRQPLEKGRLHRKYFLQV